MVAVTHLSPTNDQILQPILDRDASIEFARPPLPKHPSTSERLLSRPWVIEILPEQSLGQL